MPSISSSTTASPAFQQGFAQLKIQQAKRNAEQAEATARALQSQAADASRTAAQAQENARNLSVQADQAQSNVGRAREGLAAIRSLSETSSRLEQIYDRVAKLVNPDAAAATDAVPVVSPVEVSTVAPTAGNSPASSAGNSPVQALAVPADSRGTIGTVVDTTA